MTFIRNNKGWVAAGLLGAVFASLLLAGAIVQARRAPLPGTPIDKGIALWNMAAPDATRVEEFREAMEDTQAVIGRFTEAGAVIDPNVSMDSAANRRTLRAQLEQLHLTAVDAAVALRHHREAALDATRRTKLAPRLQDAIIEKNVQSYQRMEQWIDSAESVAAIGKSYCAKADRGLDYDREGEAFVDAWNAYCKRQIVVMQSGQASRDKVDRLLREGPPRK